MRRIRSQFPQSVFGLLLVAACLLVPASAASADPWGVVGVTANPSPAAGSLGGEFSATPSGVAVNDTTGNVYVVDSANNRIERFSSTGVFQWAIGFDVIQSGTSGDLGADVFEKCTVAADCKAGVNTVVVGGAGNEPGGELSGPQGIAINQTTGDFYVSDQGFLRIQQFDADGAFKRAWGRDVVRAGLSGDSPAASAVQTLTVDASAGTFKLSFQGQTTSDLAFNATAAQVDAALEALTSVGVNNVAVTPAGATGAPGGGTPYVITFAGALANSPQPPVTAANGATPLSGGAGTATVANTVTGSNSFEICTTAADCKRGTAPIGNGAGGTFGGVIGYVAVAPAGALNAGNVVVGDGNRNRVQEFTASGQFVRTFGFDVVNVGPGETPTDQFEICRATDFDVCKNGTPGAGVGQFANASISTANLRVGVDTNGSIYTVDAAAPGNNFRVQKFTPSGGGLVPSLFNPAISLTGSLSGTSVTDSPTDVAVDPTNNHVYVVKAFPAGEGNPVASVAERRVLEFDAAGSLVETHIANYAVNSVRGLAVKASGGSGYLTSVTGTPRLYTLGTPVQPTVAVEATTAVTATTATLNGTVNPNGGEPALNTTYRFEYSPDGTNWTKAPAANVDIGGGSATVVVSQDIAGLQPNRPYQVRLVANKGGSPTTSTGTDGDFTTDPTAPSATTLDAFWDGSTGELTIRGLVNPNNQDTDYYFEYGTDTDYGSSIPVTEDADAGDGGQPIVVAQQLADLDSDSSYHYRVVAVNDTGTTAGEDRIVAAYSQPEERAHEWVSRGDSWGIGILGASWAIGAISDDGDRVGFSAQTFNQPESEPGPSNPVTARRTASGWTTSARVPDASVANGSYSGTWYMSSADGTTTLWPEATRAGRQRGEVGWGLIHDNGRTEAFPTLQPINQTGPAVLGSEYRLVGGSADLSTFVFKWSNGQGTIQLLPDEPLLPVPVRFQSNLYAVTGAGGANSRLTVVNRATDPSPGVRGAVIGGACGAGLGGRLFDESDPTPQRIHRAVSINGSVVYFTAIPDATAAGTGTCAGNVATERRRLYKRVDDSTTVQVSAAQCTDPCLDSGSNSDLFKNASLDGSVVAFVSPRQLVDADDDTTVDLYLYDESPPAGQPTLAQASAGEVVAGEHPNVGQGAQVVDVHDMSADGSRVYFTARGVLAGPNALGAAPVAGQLNMYVFERDGEHPAGRIEFVAGGLDVTDARNLVGGDAALALPNGEIDGDGRFLLFTASAPLLPQDVDSARDVYRYEDATGELLCLSCAGNANLGVAVGGLQSVYVQSLADAPLRGRAASGDVSTVVFATREALLDADQNTAPDAYMWREGTLSLVSGATGSEGTSFSPAGDGAMAEPTISPDGRDVFFVTLAGLDPADGNNVADIYDARVGGGFPIEPPPPDPCDALADDCQGDGADSAQADDRTATGGGNADAQKRGTLSVASLSKRARKKASRTGRLALSIRASSPGLVSVSVWARLGKRVRVGHASKPADNAGAVTLKVRLSERARRRLEAGKSLRLSIVVGQSGARTRTTSVLLSGVKS